MLADRLAPLLARHGLHYGWVMVALTFLVSLASAGALGVLGAGDVKLFAAGAAWLGPAGVWPATTYAALAGGVLALGWVVLGRRRPLELPARSSAAARPRV